MSVVDGFVVQPYPLWAAWEGRTGRVIGWVPADDRVHPVVWRDESGAGEPWVATPSDDTLALFEKERDAVLELQIREDRARKEQTRP